MKHETILVPVKCSERLPEREPINEDDKWLTDIGRAFYFTKTRVWAFKAIGMQHICFPTIWYEEQYDKIVLSEEEYEQLKIQSLKLPKTHLKTPWSK